MKRQKTGKYDLYDDTVTSVNPETRDITFTHKANNVFYSASYYVSDLFRFIIHNTDIEDMPKVNLKVRVVTYSGSPSESCNCQIYA